MDDATALRVKKVELSLHAAEKGAEIQAHRCIAILAVGLTLGASAALAGLAQQVPPLASMAGTGTGSGLVFLQLRALRLVAAELRSATEEAMASIDKLMAQEGNSDVDGQADP